jgi:flagellin
MNANRNLGVTTSNQAKATEKLSSGFKINRAADDASGLSISEKMRRQIRGLSQASKNAQDGISMAQTAEGALTEVHDMLQRMNELANKAATGTMSTSDRTDVKNEIDALNSEIDRVATTTKFNEKFLMDATKAVTLQVGADGKTDNTITVNLSKMSSSGISSSKVDVTSQTKAQQSLSTIEKAIKSVSAQRSALGAVQNRLEHTIKNLDNVIENTTSSEASIRDTDMATQMVEYSKNNILAQAGQSMLAQANQSNQGVLSLLQ